MKALLRLYKGSIKALLRLYSGSVKYEDIYIHIRMSSYSVGGLPSAPLSLIHTSIKALLRLYKGSIKAP
jgi:hypothetical protein